MDDPKALTLGDRLRSYARRNMRRLVCAGLLLVAVSLLTLYSMTRGDEITLRLTPAEKKLAAEKFSRLRSEGGMSRCFITQRGWDGFGHQYDGKISVIAMADLHKDKFVYVHTKFWKFDHTWENPKNFEEFINIAHLFPQYDELNAAHGPLRLIHKEMHIIYDEYVQGKLDCRDNVVYWHDNAWDVMENIDYDRLAYMKMVAGSELFRNLRKAYFGSPKPEVDFVPNRQNVVVHIRRGDSMEPGRGALGGNYYDRAIDYMVKYYKKIGEKQPPMFIIETDSPKWEYLNVLYTKFGKDNFRMGKIGSGGIKSALHKMVLADGFVTSMSSMSKVAVMLRNQSKPIVACYPSDNGKWFYFSSESVVYVCPPDNSITKEQWGSTFTEMEVG